MKPPILSVNTLLAREHALHGTLVCVYGAYTIDFEDSAILHLPKSERRPADRFAVWVAPTREVRLTDHSGALLESDDLSFFCGKRVLLTGTVQSGGGHMGLARCTLVTTELQRIKSLPST